MITSLDDHSRLLLYARLVERELSWHHIQLVTTGPYAYVRNPMLTGVFIWLFGLGILLRSISLVFMFTPLFVLLNVLELKAIEEPELEKRLGKEYLEYQKRLPMFIPWFKVKTKK